MGRPVLDRLNLTVNDMEASVSFYRALGLEIPETTVCVGDPDGNHVGIMSPPEPERRTEPPTI